MSTSELKYIIAIKELSKEQVVTLAAIAEKTGVSKVSAYKAVERLTECELTTREKGILLTDKGDKAVEEYGVCIAFVSEKLKDVCGIPDGTTFGESLNIVCAVSDFGRKKLYGYLKERGKKNVG